MHFALMHMPMHFALHATFLEIILGIKALLRPLHDSYDVNS